MKLKWVIDVIGLIYLKQKPSDYKSRDIKSLWKKNNNPQHIRNTARRELERTPQLDPISTATERTGELKWSTKESNRHIAQRQKAKLRPKA